MGKKALQCLFIGKPLKVYKDISNLLTEFNLNLQVKQVVAKKPEIVRALKKQRVASLVFVSKEIPISFEMLSDIIWQFSPDSIVTILMEEPVSGSFVRPFNNTQFAKHHYKEKGTESRVYLQYLIQTAQLKWEFRHCKRLLGVSEKRSQWLVDSSNQAVAFILRDLHLYANNAYLGLFDIDSIHDLPSIPLQDIFLDEEFFLFKSFIKRQTSSHEITRSLVLSLRKQNGQIFRANIHVIQSVFKGKKCFQLWVYPLNTYEMSHEQKLDFNQNIEQQNDHMTLRKSDTKVLNQGKYTMTSILRSIIKRKEAVISAQRLTNMQVNSNRVEVVSHLLSLKVPTAQRVGIENLLEGLGTVDIDKRRKIFWDKVKFTRLLQTLVKKKNLSVNLFIRLNEESISDESFTEWFMHGLRKIGVKSSRLIILLPSQVDENYSQPFMKFATQLRTFGCQIALDNFSISKTSLLLLKHVRPDYAKLSLPWVRQIEGKETRELALGRFIRQLEAKDIKVIAPCGFSKNMRKLFTLSGVSFCQERTIKSA